MEPDWRGKRRFESEAGVKKSPWSGEPDGKEWRHCKLTEYHLHFGEYILLLWFQNQNQISAVSKSKSNFRRFKIKIKFPPFQNQNSTSAFQNQNSTSGISKSKFHFRLPPHVLPWQCSSSFGEPQLRLSGNGYASNCSHLLLVWNCVENNWINNGLLHWWLPLMLVSKFCISVSSKYCTLWVN